MDAAYIGERIRNLRKEKGLTLKEVAGEEFTKGYVSQVELGRVTPSFKLLAHIANKLEINIEQLMGGEKDIDYILVLIEGKFIGEKYEEVLLLSQSIDASFISPIVLKVKVLQAKAYYFLGKLNECINLSKEILTIDEHWSLTYRLEVYAFLAISLFGQKLYLDAIEVYDKALELASINALNDYILLSKLYLNKATALQNLGEYNQAISVFNQAMDFCREHNTMETALDCFVRLGFCHYKAENLATAKKFIYDGLNINKILDIKLPQAEALLVLSFIFLKEENFKSAEVIAKKAYLFFNQLNKVEGMVEALLVQAKAYIKTKGKNEITEILLEIANLIENSEIDKLEHETLREVANLCMEYELYHKASYIFSKLINTRIKN